MSYILEALKKSEYEREHGDVPGIQTDHHIHLVDDDQKKSWKKYVFIFVMSINLIFVVAWFYTEQSDVVISESQPGKSRTAIPEVTGKAVEQIAIKQVARIPEPAAMQDRPIIAEPNIPSLKQAMPGHPVEVSEKKLIDKQVKNAVSTKSPAREVKRSLIAEPEIDSRNVVRISQLPDSVQQRLPDLKYSGHLYSSNPLRRKLIINGRGMREGEWVSDNLQLDEITMSGAIFSYKEYYYRVELLRNWSAN